MHTRRSHKKSRAGCTSCKQRRVKCDEQGPPCGQCDLRGTECEYTVTRTGQTVSRSQTSTGSSISKSPSVPPPSGNTLPVSARSRLLELELMHRWSTNTYKSFCSDLAGQVNIWQSMIPHEALGHDFLLSGILAASSLEIATRLKPAHASHYIEAALEYQNLATSSFRAELVTANPSREKCFAMYAFTLIVMILRLAFARVRAIFGEKESMIDLMSVHYELLRGVGVLLLTYYEQLHTSPLVAGVAEMIEQLPAVPLDEDTVIAIGRLEMLNNARRPKKTAADPSESVAAASYHAACENAIRHLRVCFDKCAYPLAKGYCLGWHNLSGAQYMEALKEKDAVALLIVMHWGVLVERLSCDIWWAQLIGRNVVLQASDFIPKNSEPEVKASVRWAQEQVGLRAGPTDLCCTTITRP